MALDDMDQDDEVQDGDMDLGDMVLDDMVLGDMDLDDEVVLKCSNIVLYTYIPGIDRTGKVRRTSSSNVPYFE